MDGRKDGVCERVSLTLCVYLEALHIYGPRACQGFWAAVVVFTLFSKRFLFSSWG